MLRFMTLSVRTANERDLDAIVGLLHESDVFHQRQAPDFLLDSGAPLRAEEYVTHLLNEDNGTIIVAEEEGSIVGLVQMAFYERRREPTIKIRPFAIIGDVVVTEERRGTGVGKALMAAAEAWARERGAVEIELGVWEFNDPAIGLYEAIGYRIRRHTMMKPLD